MARLGRLAGLTLIAAAACNRPESLPEGPRIAVSESRVTLTTTAGGTRGANLEVANSGSGVLVTPTVEVRYPGSSGWLSPSLVAEGAGYQLALLAYAGSLPVGTYYATVVLDSPGAINSPLAVGVTCVVEEPRLAIAAPIGTELHAALGWSGPAGTVDIQVQEMHGAPTAEITFTVLYEDGDGWLQIAPSPYWGYTLSPRTAGLARGTYRATLTASATGVAPASAPVTLVVDDWGTFASYPDGFCGTPLQLDPDRLLCLSPGANVSRWNPFTGERVDTGWWPGTVLTSAFRSAFVGQGKVLVTGVDANAQELAWLLFDPATGELLGQGAITEGVGLNVVPLADGRALLFGGYPDDTKRTTLVFDPATLTLTRTGDQVKRRPGAAVVRLADGRVLAAGGSVYQTNGFDPTPMGSAELYDPTMGRWAETGWLTTARGDAWITLLPDGRVLMAGGTAGGQVLAGAELYDPATATWTRTGGMAQGHASGGPLTRLPDGTLLLAERGAAQSQRYDPATGRWSAWADLPGVYQEQVLVLGDFVFLVGGGGTAYRRAAFP